jgi:hypothetical protein
MQNMVNGFITAETGTKESLEQQVKNYESNLDALETAIKNGTPNVTQEMVNQAQSMVDAAKEELDKFPAEAAKRGEQGGSDFAEGVGDQAGKAKKAGEKIGTDADSGADAGSKGMKKTGKDAGKDYASGVDSEKEDAKKAGETLASKAEEGSKEHDSYSSGSFFGEGFFDGIGSWIDSVWTKAKELASSAWNGLKAGGKEGSPWKTTIASGEFFGEGFEIGIASRMKAVNASAAKMAKQAVTALSAKMDEQMYTLGSGSAESLKNGLKDALPEMANSINGLKATVATSNNGIGGGNSVDVGSFDAGGGRIQNVTFNQTINSPKAPSRLELYQETNSLLFSAKVRLENV